MKKEQIKSLLLRWRDQTVPAASALVSEMFKSVDRVLLEYADKAESGEVQVQFFEGQREIWLKQDQVASQFHDTLHHEFFNFTRQSSPHKGSGEEALSLVSKDDFERSLALQTIADEAVGDNPALYFALSHRLGVISGGKPLALHLLPAGPHQLASVFERAASQFNVERPVQLALYTLFEREVVAKSTGWHEQLNELLIKTGILPNLRYEAQGRGSAKATGTGTESAKKEDRKSEAAPGEGELGDEVLSRIRELLSAQRARRAAARGTTPRAEPAHPAPPSVVVETIDRTPAAEMPESAVLQRGAQRAPVSPGLLERIKGALTSQREQIKQSVGPNRLSLVDEDAIDIVGMLFEVMLNDKRLSNTVKALLSHLHTPFLKVAIRDRAFLDQTGHPARRLFDQLVEAGSRWVDERDLSTGLYPTLQSTVERISRAKEHPVQLFQELEDRLAAETSRLEERQRIREARTVQSEKGMARLEEAREAAMRAARGLFEIDGAPNLFQSFVTGPWTDFLTLVYLRSAGNTDSGAWRGAVVLGERLRAFTEGLLSEVLPTASDVRQLRAEMNRRLGGLIPQYQGDIDRLFDLLEGRPAEAEPAAAVTRPAPRGTAKPERPEPIELSAKGEDLVEQLAELPPGTWIVFHGENDTDQVVKLSWYNAKTERFLFVDQSGAKASAMRLRELAAAVDSETAHILHATGSSYVESSLKRAMKALEQRG